MSGLRRRRRRFKGWTPSGSLEGLSRLNRTAKTTENALRPRPRAQRRPRPRLRRGGLALAGVAVAYGARRQTVAGLRPAPSGDRHGKTQSGNTRPRHGQGRRRGERADRPASRASPLDRPSVLGGAHQVPINFRVMGSLMGTLLSQVRRGISFLFYQVPISAHQKTKSALRARDFIY